MKKYYLLLLLSGSLHPAMAQHQEEAAFALLDSIGQRNFQATFTYSSRSPQGQLGETFEGKIAVQGYQLRLTVGGQEIVNNGQTVWTYLPEANEVQITAQDPGQTVEVPWAVLANYRQDYVLLNFCTQQISGQVYNVIDLLAKDEENSLPKITLTIERTTKHIKRLETLDSNQTLHIFSIADFAYDLKFDEAFFNFNPEEHQGIEIIDMR